MPFAARICVILLLAQFAFALLGQAYALEIISGETVRLNDGRILRLAAVRAPDDPVLADAATARLAELLLGENVTSKITGSDRYGRLLGDLGTAQSPSVQAILLGEGLASFYPVASPPANAAVLQASELAAQQAKRGLWADPAAILRSEHAWPALGRYAFVIGRVLEIKRVKDKVYINFGADWREDFTIQVAARDLRSLKKTGLDVMTLTDKRIMARGWIEAQNGPMLTLTQSWQLVVDK